MTPGLDDDIDLTPPEPVPFHAKTCAKEGCTNLLPPDAHRLRRYCDEHFEGSHKKPKRRVKRDTAPHSVTVNLGPPKTQTKGDKELQAVEDRVKQLLNLVSGALMVAGQSADALDIQANRDSVAQALKELAKYEPWLKRLAAGGEMGDRAVAWVAAVMAVAAMLIPICDRRGLIPAQIRPMLVQAVAVPVDVPSGDAEPVAA